jgi:glutaredoxin-like protein NrdH
LTTVYTKPNCTKCTWTKRKLNKMGVPYVEVDITEDDDARDYVLSLGHREAPVVVPARGESWSGYSELKLEALAA